MLFCKFKKFFFFGPCKYYHYNSCIGSSCKHSIKAHKEWNKMVHYGNKHQ